MIERTYKIYSLSLDEIRTVIAQRFKVDSKNVDLHISEYSNDFGDHSIDLCCEVKVEED